MLSPKTIKRKTVATEHRIARELGGKRVFASGSGFEKGDARVRQTVTTDAAGVPTSFRGTDILIESKRTFTASLRYSLTALTMLKLVKSAAATGSMPVLHIQTKHIEWAVIQTLFWISLTDANPAPPERTGVRSVQLNAYDWLSRLAKHPASVSFYELKFTTYPYGVAVMHWPRFVELVKSARSE